MNEGNPVDFQRVVYLCIQFEPAVWCEHHDRGRPKWIFRGQKDAKVIQSAFKFGARRSTQCAMPFLINFSASIKAIVSPPTKISSYVHNQFQALDL